MTDTNGFSRARALELLEEWTKGESLRKHGMAVSVCTEAYGRIEAARHGLTGGEAEAFAEPYACAGLLHDMDYERHPSLDEHPFVGVAALREQGWPEGGASGDSGACWIIQGGAGDASAEGALCLR